MSALDNYLRNHKDFCHNHEYSSGNCFCGRNEAAAELTKLRAELNDYKDCRHDLLDKVDILTASLSSAQKEGEEARGVMEIVAGILPHAHEETNVYRGRLAATAWLKRNPK